MLEGTLTLNEESKKRHITMTFAKKEMHDKSPEDITNSTIKALLNKYVERDEKSSSSADPGKTASQKAEEEKQRMISLLKNTKTKTKKALTQKQRAQSTQTTCQAAKKKKKKKKYTTQTHK